MNFFIKLLFVIFIFKTNAIIAQSNIPKWLSYQYSNKVWFQTALIKVDGINTTYNDLFKIADTSLLKVEVYSKKAAQQFVDKDEARNGLVLVTLHKKHYPFVAVKKDTAIFIIENEDTIYCKHAQPAMLGDTTNRQWIQFLQHSLKSQVPADNSAPAGLYNVDITFLVEKNGMVSNVEILEDPGYGTANEVRRLMKESPLWTPAMCNDEVVVYRQKERITFFVVEQY